VYVILPETKNISLERMDKLFGQVDVVEAGEEEALDRKVAALGEDKDGTTLELREHTAQGQQQA
jgi:hypothetical protein